MGLRFPPQCHGEYFFVTTTFKNWDRLGDITGFYDKMAESLAFCLRKYTGRLIGYVFMLHHVHFVVHIDGHSLPSLMRDFKKYVAQKIAADYGVKGGIWMPRYDRVAIFNEDVLRTKLAYIHDNPVKAGLADTAHDWKWSSADDYDRGKEGPLPIWKSWI